MVCSIDDIVSRRPGKHTRFPVAYSPYLFMVFFSVSLSLSLSLSVFSTQFTVPRLLSLYRFSSLSLLFHSRAWNRNFEYLITVEKDTLLGTIHLSRGNMDPGRAIEFRAVFIRRVSNVSFIPGATGVNRRRNRFGFRNVDSSAPCIRGMPASTVLSILFVSLFFFPFFSSISLLACSDLLF